MNRDEKAAVIDEIAGEISSAQAVFAVDYRGISVSQAARLRTSLRDVDAHFRVVKNRLTARAVDQAGAQALAGLLVGPTALTFVRGDAAAAAKALADAARATQVLDFKGGLLDGAAVSAEEIRAIARLPGRQALYGQLVGIVASPVSRLARTLNALVGGLAIQLGQIAEQGLVSGQEPAAADAEPAAEAPAAGREPAADAEPAEAAAEDVPTGADAAPDTVSTPTDASQED